MKGGAVVDGTGAEPFLADVRVRGGRIAEVGSALRPDGEATIDCSGAYVSPGFIDNHTHFDPSLFWDPSCDPMALHGVTCVVTGNCSLSLAPVRAGDRRELVDLFSFIEDIPSDAFEAGVPWTWQSYPEYVEALRARSFGVNVAQLVGHTPLRTFVMGEEAWERAASEQEIAGMAEVLSECLAAGALGLSTSFFDRSADGRPVPSRYADDTELLGLNDVLAGHSGLLQFIPDVGTAEPYEDVERIGRLCGAKGVVAMFNGAYHWDTQPARGQRFLDQCSALQARGAQVFPQISPRSLDMRINWDNSLLFMQLRESWNRAILARGADKLALLRDDEWRAQARYEWDHLLPVHSALGTPGNVKLIEVTRPENARWLGKALLDLMNDSGQHPSDALADWVCVNDGRPGVVAAGVANANVEAVAAMLQHPATILGNSDAGAHLQMMCAAGDSTLLLVRHVRERGDLTVERAVHMMTGRQCELLRLEERGAVKPGAHADLTVFSLEDLGWEAEEFVSDLPGSGRRLRRPGGGYRFTIVDGDVVQESDVPTGSLPGRLLAGASA